MNPSPQIDREHVGPYQLVKAIGAGGSARVDLARIERAYGFQRHVVIKRPLEHLRADVRAAESLRREARLGGRLRHPNLVAILDAGVHDNYDYLVLEYVHGGSLRTLMQSDDPARVREQPLDVALAIVRDIARGLHDAHELTDEHGAPLGLVHRDVSPGNVLIGLDGSVKLADFGIAKETRVATLSGSMHGTVTYMAPEQCRGHAFDRRADVFSLGVILYELVTGMRLFWADNDVASLHRVLAGTVPRPRKVKPGIAAALEDIVMTAVAQDPMRRFATARAFADAIEAHGSAAGEILAARRVAYWVHELIGPRDAPWIGENTRVDIIEPVHDLPLVELIAATPADEPPPPPTFGPIHAGIFEDAATDTERALPPRRRRTLMAAMIGAGLIAGSAATALLMTREPERASRAEPSAPAAETRVTEPAPSAPPTNAAESDDPTTNAGDPTTNAGDPTTNVGDPTTNAGDPTSGEPTDPSTGETDGIELDERGTAPDSKRPTRKRHRPRSKSPTAAATPPPAPPQTGSGSATRPPKVHWDPTMLLPTDKAGSKKR